MAKLTQRCVLVRETRIVKQSPPYLFRLTTLSVEEDRFRNLLRSDTRV